MLTIDLAIGDRVIMPDPDTGYMCEWIIRDKAGVLVGRGKKAIPCTRLDITRAIRPKLMKLTIPDNYEWNDPMLNS